MPATPFGLAATSTSPPRVVGAGDHAAPQRPGSAASRASGAAAPKHTVSMSYCDQSSHPYRHDGSAPFNVRRVRTTSLSRRWRLEVEGLASLPLRCVDRQCVRARLDQPRPPVLQVGMDPRSAAEVIGTSRIRAIASDYPSALGAGGHHLGQVGAEGVVDGGSRSRGGRGGMPQYSLRRVGIRNRSATKRLNHTPGRRPATASRQGCPRWAVGRDLTGRRPCRPAALRRRPDEVGYALGRQLGASARCRPARVVERAP